MKEEEPTTKSYQFDLSLNVLIKTLEPMSEKDIYKLISDALWDIEKFRDVLIYSIKV